MEEEIWLETKDFSDYEVSNMGRLRRKTKNGYKYQKLSTRDKDGYVKASMNKDGKRHYLRMHRIVADNFIENPDFKPVVNHKNGIKDDNRAENLEWSTISENTQHGFDTLGRIGQNGGTNQRVKVLYDSGEIFCFNSQLECSKFLGLSLSYVSSTIKRDEENKKRKTRKYTIVRDCEGVTTIETA